MEMGAMDNLDDLQKLIIRELEKAQVETLLAEYEIDLRRTDASEPPKMLSGIFFTEVPSIIAKPKTHDQARECVRICRKHGVPLVVRGAASSAFGAVLPPDRGVVVDLGDMTGVISIDGERLVTRALSGTRWADLSIELKKAGLALKTSPSSFFSTIGGWLSTGGLGINSFSSGDLSSHVEEVRVVFPDGTDATVPRSDPRFRLFVGTEGQLGVITEMTIHIRRQPKFHKSVLLQTSTDSRAVRLIEQLLGLKAHISHIMYFDEGRSKELNHLTPIPGKPLHDSPAVLVHLEADEVEGLKFDVPEQVSWSEAPKFMANLLWGDRYFPMRGRKLGPGMLGSELMMPLEKLPKFLPRIRKLGKIFGVEIASEAHIISGKEVLLLSFFTTDQRRPLVYAIHSILSMLITRLGIEYSGRPYAIGVWNQPFSSFVVPEEKIADLRRKKQELDPDDLFNPSRFLSRKTKFSMPIQILLKKRITLFALGAFLALAEFVGSLTRTRRTEEHDDLSPLQLSTFACARCGACVSVCPAYMISGREIVTGRGKLLAARKAMAGKTLSAEEAWEIFLCMKCQACEEVCQTRLPLLSAYEELEELLERSVGRPKELIDQFVEEVEASAEYERLLYEGVISPDAGVKEGESDAV